MTSWVKVSSQQLACNPLNFDLRTLTSELWTLTSELWPQVLDLNQIPRHDKLELTKEKQGAELKRLVATTRTSSKSKKTTPTSKVKSRRNLKRGQCPGINLKNIKMYSGDLKSRCIRIWNGRKEVGWRMVQISNGIYNPEAGPLEIWTNGCH